ncbi:MAG: Hpt domain-containing protein [Oligoflexia bacterium]|nr:Hpt domain-containing protein [Oligoflexia bacterium]
MDWDADPELRELRARFAATFSERAEALREALARGDRERLRQLAHALAGAAGSYGYGVIGDAAAALEEGLAGGEADAGLVARLLAQLDQAR